MSLWRNVRVVLASDCRLWSAEVAASLEKEGARLTTAGFGQSARHLEGDLRDRLLVKRVVEGQDALFYLEHPAQANPAAYGQALFLKVSYLLEYARRSQLAYVSLAWSALSDERRIFQRAARELAQAYHDYYQLPLTQVEREDWPSLVSRA